MPGINKDTSGVASNTSATRSAVLAFARQITEQQSNQPVVLGDKDARLFAVEYLRLFAEKGGGGDEANKPGPDHFETRELGLGMAVKLHEGEDVDPARLVYMTLLCDMLLSCRFDEQLIEFAKKGEHPNRVLEIWAQG